jgi:DNA-binding transcriptional LysR family regulator
MDGRLERDLGSKLFERTPDGFVLTEAGQGSRVAAEQMEQCALAVEQRALGADLRLSGVVRVAATESVGHTVVLPAMRQLHRRHPEIRLHLLTGLARLDIARREADLALRLALPESGELRARRLTPMGFALCLAGVPRPPPAACAGAGFAGHDVVLFDEQFRGSSAIAALLEPLRDGRAVVRANSLFSLVEAVAAGLGVGALTCCVADAHPGLRRVYPQLPPARDDLWLVVHADVQRTGRIRALIAAVEARCAEARSLLRG